MTSFQQKQILHYTSYLNLLKFIVSILYVNISSFLSIIALIVTSVFLQQISSSNQSTHETLIQYLNNLLESDYINKYWNRTSLMLRILQRKDTQQDFEGISKYIIDKYQEETKKIFIYGFNVGSTGAKCLISHNFSTLIALSLGGAQITDNALQIIMRVKWPDLTTLQLADNKISDKGVKILSRAFLPSLTNLYLQDNKITSQSIKYMVSTHWKDLSLLELGKNQLGMNATVQLNGNNWGKLQEIRLYENKLNICSILQLNAGKWTQLVRVWLYKNQQNQLLNQIAHKCLSQRWEVWIQE